MIIVRTITEFQKLLAVLDSCYTFKLNGFCCSYKILLLLAF